MFATGRCRPASARPRGAASDPASRERRRHRARHTALKWLASPRATRSMALSWPDLLQIQRDKTGFAVAVRHQQHRDLLALPLERVDPLLHVGRAGDGLILHLDD